MIDELHPVSKLGKTLNDIGGPLDSITIELDLGSTGPMLLDPNYRGYEAYSYPLPSWSIPTSEELAVTAGNALRYAVEVASYPNSLSGEEVWDRIVFSANPLHVQSSDDLDMYGTTAIDRVQPRTPAVDIATTVAEFISEWGFFSLPGTNDSLSGEYLNYALGVTPTVSTIHDLRKVMESKEEILRQYERDAGRLVRRRYEFPKVVESKRFEDPSELPKGFDTLASISWYGNYGSQVTNVRSSHEVWFEGAFTYSIPETGWRRELSELDRLYGIMPGVDTAWELIPFSFVADYFANMGSVVSNFNAFALDGLVMPFGYIMSRKIYEAEYTWTGPLSIGERYVTKELAVKTKTTVKQRRAATPFGFGFDMGSLTPRQGSILAALGMSAIRT